MLLGLVRLSKSVNSATTKARNAKLKLLVSVRAANRMTLFICCAG